MSLSFNPNFEFVSTNNSSTANLNAGATFTGIADDIRDIDVVHVTFLATSSCTLVIEQSPDGTNWDIQDTYYYTANDGFSMSVTAMGLFYRILVTNTGGAATTSLRLQAQFSSGIAAAPRSLGRKTSDQSFPVVIASDQLTPGTVTSTYSEVTLVAASTLTTVVTYTAPAKAYLQKVSVAGTNIAEFTCTINGVVQDKRYTYFGGPLSVDMDFSERGLPLASGDIVRARVTHNRPFSGTFNGRIQAVEL